MSSLAEATDWRSSAGAIGGAALSDSSNGAGDRSPKRSSCPSEVVSLASSAELGREISREGTERWTLSAPEVASTAVGIDSGSAAAADACSSSARAKCQCDLSLGSGSLVRTG